jgi:hypothetical protein
MRRTLVVLLLGLPLLAQAYMTNESPATAQVITFNMGNINGNTVGNLDDTGGYGLPTGCTPRNDYAYGLAGMGPDVWYKIYIAQSVPLHVFCCQQNFNVMLGIWDANLNLINANDDWCGPGGRGAQTCCVVEPGWYYISVDGSNAVDQGEYTLHVNISTCTGDENPVEPVGTDDQPAHFSMSPAHPNPFNPETVLTIAIPETGPASLKVYNLAGREVATLLNGLASAGTQELRFQAGQLPSGVYFAVLRAGGRSATQKLLLVK